tara:strand:- start:2761 stop:3006 length:246 start_codon:yes stop_codon:yes gene_type:complete
MKTISLLIALFGLSACFATNNGTAENGAKPMKQYASIERIKCPKYLYRGVGKRIECKLKVREELNAKENSKSKGKTDETEK